MANGRESVRVQLTLNARTGGKIAELAERMNVSESKMIELLLDAAIDDNEWIIKAVTSRWANAIVTVFGGAARKGRRSNAGA